MSTCEGGCVEDGIEIVAVPDAGALQLCAPRGAVARPLSPAEARDVPICSAEGYACVDEIVRLCEGRGQAARLVGKCLKGCALYVELEPGETKDLDGALAILCRRDDAERR